MQKLKCRNCKTQYSKFCKFQLCNQLAYICDFCHNYQHVHKHHNKEEIQSNKIYQLITVFLQKYGEMELQQTKKLVKQTKEFINKEITLTGSQMKVFHQNLQKYINDDMKSIKILQQKIEKDKNNILAYEQLIYLFLKTNDFISARIYAQKILQINQNDYNTYYLLDTIYKSSNQLQKFLIKYSNQITINPSNKLLYYKRGRIYAIIKQFDKALQDFHKVIQIDSKFYLVYNSIGLIYYNRNQYEKAYHYYEKTLQFNPKFPNAYNNIGLIYYNQKLFNKAISYYNKAIRYNPNYSIAYYNIALLYHDIKQIQSAIQYYHKSIELDKRFQYKVNAYHNIAIIYDEKQQFQKSLFYYDQAIKHNPKNAQFYYSKGQIYLKLKLEEKAKIQFQKSLQHINQSNIENLDSYLVRGITYFNLLEYDKAELDFKKIIQQKQNDNPQPYYYLCRIYMNRGQLQRALSFISEAIRFVKYVIAQYYYYKIVLLRCLGYNQTAEVDQEKILKGRDNKIQILKRIYKIEKNQIPKMFNQ